MLHLRPLQHLSASTSTGSQPAMPQATNQSAGSLNNPGPSRLFAIVHHLLHMPSAAQLTNAKHITESPAADTLQVLPVRTQGGAPAVEWLHRTHRQLTPTCTTPIQPGACSALRFVRSSARSLAPLRAAAAALTAAAPRPLRPSRLIPAGYHSQLPSRARVLRSSTFLFAQSRIREDTTFLLLAHFPAPSRCNEALSIA